ncbi:hypothetical protein MRX96_037147 [Rhipicephalus microplus]
MCCSSTYLEEGVVTSEKVVLFLCDKPPDGYCKVFVRGRLIGERIIKCQEEAESVEATELCIGALNAKDYDTCFLTAGLQKQLKIKHATYFSINCSGKVTTKGGQCMSCKYFRKALLTMRSRVQRTPSRASNAAVAEETLIDMTAA